jgi:hypothetical protein
LLKWLIKLFHSLTYSVLEFKRSTALREQHLAHGEIPLLAWAADLQQVELLARFLAAAVAWVLLAVEQVAQVASLAALEAVLGLVQAAAVVLAHLLVLWALQA